MSEKIEKLKDLVKRFREIERETQERRAEIAHYEVLIDRHGREDGIELKAKDKKTAIEKEADTIDETDMEKWIADVEEALKAKTVIKA